MDNINIYDAFQFDSFQFDSFQMDGGQNYETKFGGSGRIRKPLINKDEQRKRIESLLILLATIDDL